MLVHPARLCFIAPFSRGLISQSGFASLFALAVFSDFFDFLHAFMEFSSFGCLLLYHIKLFFVLSFDFLSSHILQDLGFLLSKQDIFSKVIFYFLFEFKFAPAQLIHNKSLLFVINPGSQLFHCESFLEINVLVFILLGLCFHFLEQMLVMRRQSAGYLLIFVFNQGDYLKLRNWSTDSRHLVQLFAQIFQQQNEVFKAHLFAEAHPQHSLVQTKFLNLLLLCLDQILAFNQSVYSFNNGPHEAVELRQERVGSLQQLVDYFAENSSPRCKLKVAKDLWQVLSPYLCRQMLENKSVLQNQCAVKLVLGQLVEVGPKQHRQAVACQQLVGCIDIGACQQVALENSHQLFDVL